MYTLYGVLALAWRHKEWADTGIESVPDGHKFGLVPVTLGTVAPGKRGRDLLRFLGLPRLINGSFLAPLLAPNPLRRILHS